MAPKSTSTGTIEESDTKVYNYDGDPLNRYPWAEVLCLEKRVFAHDPRFRTHIQYGYHMTGHRTITQSSDHSINLYHKNVAQSTWADPACMGHWQYAGALSAAVSGGTIPADEASNYLPAPHDWDAIDKAIIEFILSTVTDETEKEDMEEECNGDARTLIRNIQAYRRPRHSQAASGQRSSRSRRGKMTPLAARRRPRCSSSAPRPRVAAGTLHATAAPFRPAVSATRRR